jgi:hypothetical protein
MAQRTYFIPGMDFELIASDNQALAAFQKLLASIGKAQWNVIKAEEAIDNNLKGLTLTMTREEATDSAATPTPSP